MSVLSLLRADRTNAALSWAFAAGFVLVAAVRTVGGEFLLAGLALAAAAVCVTPAVATGSVRAMPPWEFVSLLALPTVVRVAVPGSAFTRPATYLAVATFSLLVAVHLNALTDVRMSRSFAVAFVVTTTMAVAGVWTVAQFASDTLAGTDFLVSEDALMRDLVVSTATGVLGGALFAVYFHETPAGGLRGARRPEEGERA